MTTLYQLKKILPRDLANEILKYCRPKRMGVLAVGRSELLEYATDNDYMVVRMGDDFEYYLSILGYFAHRYTDMEDIMDNYNYNFVRAKQITPASIYRYCILGAIDGGNTQLVLDMINDNKLTEYYSYEIGVEVIKKRNMEIVRVLMYNNNNIYCLIEYLIINDHYDIIIDVIDVIDKYTGNLVLASIIHTLSLTNRIPINKSVEYLCGLYPLQEHINEPTHSMILKLFDGDIDNITKTEMESFTDVCVELMQTGVFKHVETLIMRLNYDVLRECGYDLTYSNINFSVDMMKHFCKMETYANETSFIPIFRDHIPDIFEMIEYIKKSDLICYDFANTFIHDNCKISSIMKIGRIHRDMLPAGYDDRIYYVETGRF